MGKTKGGKKKSGGGGAGANNEASDAPLLMLKRVQGIKEDGTRKYKRGDFEGALEDYLKALQVLPKDHADRAVFHSNSAACMMQINPIDYEDVIEQCSLALKIQPGFTRALLRRARAFEAFGKPKAAKKDVKEVLKSDPNNNEAKEMMWQLDPSTKPPPKKENKCSSNCSSDHEYEEVEMDDWIYEFAQIFRSRLGIDPEARADLHSLAMDTCNEALEETITSEEAQPLFDKAAENFQQVAAFSLLDCGNVYMSAAEKCFPMDVPEAYKWGKEKFSMAKEKYEQGLLVKPDGFRECFRALGHQQLMLAKLEVSFVLQQKVDLSVWDATEMFKIFDNGEEMMKAADEIRVKQGGGEENNQEDADMFNTWGNILFERSQLEYKIGVEGWEKNLEAAVRKFRLAGASANDIAGFVNDHCSNQPAAKGDEKEGEEDKEEKEGEEKQEEKEREEKQEEKEEEKEGEDKEEEKEEGN